MVGFAAMTTRPQLNPYALDLNENDDLTKFDELYGLGTCENCGKADAEHSAGKCLFEPTTFVPWGGEQHQDRLRLRLLIRAWNELLESDDEPISSLADLAEVRDSLEYGAAYGDPLDPGVALFISRDEGSTEVGDELRRGVRAARPPRSPEAARAEGDDKQGQDESEEGQEGVTPILLALTLVAHPPCAGHVAPRSSHTKKEFRRTHPCPGGADEGS
jgi:hypothetical protein